MKKWLTSGIVIILVITLWFSHFDILNALSNFIIDGLIPGTHFALNTFLTYIIDAMAALWVWRSIKNLGFSMLKRDALLGHQERQLNSQKTFAEDQKRASNPLDADDLELVQRSL